MTSKHASEESLWEAAPMLHKWHIEPEQYVRHETRRGRRHGYEWLDPKRTALVVIDMVPFFVGDPDIGHYPRGIVPNIITLAAVLRDAGGTVAWVLPAATEPSPATVELLGAKVAELYRTSGGDGPLLSRLWHEFDVASTDLLVEKSSASAFFPGRSELPTLLEALNIESVLITGTVANVCCESTARDASTLGYRTIMVADANAALRDQDLNATLHTFYRSFGDVRPTSEVIELISTGRPESSAMTR